MTNEEAIKVLSSWAECKYKPTHDAACLAIAALRAQEEAEKNDPLMSEWISVKERLPELPAGKWSSKMVLACNAKNHVSPMFYERAYVRGKSVERWKFYWDRIADVQVTHWMPLPEPPEDTP